MIAWNEDYLWRRNAAKRRRRQRIIKKTMLLVALVTAILLIAAMSMEALAAGQGTEVTSVSPIKIVMLAESEGTTTEELPEFQTQHYADWDVDEAYLLAKIAMAEAEGESVEGKAMVIMVVLNRVNTEGFPDSIQEVIHEYNERSGVYQFSPVIPGGRWWTTEPNEECWDALNLIMLQGWDESEGALYFEATYNGENTWHSRNLEYIKTVGTHNFYK